MTGTLRWLTVTAVLAVPAGSACPAARGGDLITVTYQVSDLVVPVKGGRTTEDQLLLALRTEVAPGTWQGQGGAGSVDYFPLSMSIVVNQTEDGHKLITAWLSSLRRYVERHPGKRTKP